MHSLLLAAALAASPAPKFTTPNDIVAAAPASAWRVIPPEDLLVLDLKSGARVVIQLAPAFAPVHVANIRMLARAKWWDGSAVYRVQDNYVAQWGQNESGKLPKEVVTTPPAEYDRPLAGLRVTPFPYRDSYARSAGFAGSWPIAVRGARVNLTHCYATVGVARDLTPDTGSGGELYAIIGHAPRQLDGVIAIVGRVVSGIEALSSLPRGGEALGFYKERSSDVPFISGRIAADMRSGERPSFEVMDTGSASFAAYVQKRANRRDAFYIHSAGGVDLCNAPVPVRPTSEG